MTSPSRGGMTDYASFLAATNDDDGQGNSFFAVTNASDAAFTRRMAGEFEVCLHSAWLIVRSVHDVPSNLLRTSLASLPGTIHQSRKTQG
jgi:hypothetical protein